MLTVLAMLLASANLYRVHANHVAVGAKAAAGPPVMNDQPYAAERTEGFSHYADGELRLGA